MASDVLVTTDWVAQNLRQGQAHRGRRRYDGVRRRPHRRRRRLQLDEPAPGPGPPRHHLEGRARGAARQRRRRATTTPSCSTATTTTGSPPTPSGCSRCTATRTSSSWTAAARSGSTRTAPSRRTPPRRRPPRTRRRTPTRKLRAQRDDVLKALGNSKNALVDVRSPAEYNGEIMAPPGLPETAQRMGHIPGAANVPWAQAVREDGTFKSKEELEQLYGAEGRRPRTRTSSPTAASASARRTRGSRSSTCSATRTSELRRLVDRVRVADRRPDREVAGDWSRRRWRSPVPTPSDSMPPRARVRASPALLQLSFDAAVLEKYRGAAGFTLMRTDTVGRIKKQGGWSLDFGIAPGEATVHASWGAWHLRCPRPSASTGLRTPTPARAS